MVKINELIVNGKSTSQFPFPVFVEENDGFRLPKKKNSIIETKYTTGGIKETVNAWPPIEKSYVIYCPTATLKDLRQVKLWAKDYGKLVASDDPDVYYEILDTDLSHSKLEPVSGYRIALTFTVQPFGFEHKVKTNTYNSGQVLVNATNAPMYPRVVINGTSNKQTSIAIGKQKIYIANIQGKITIECKFLEQNVFDHNNARANHVMRGDFFEILPDSKNNIQLGPGINSIDILERWCWL